MSFGVFFEFFRNIFSKRRANIIAKAKEVFLTLIKRGESVVYVFTLSPLENAFTSGKITLSPLERYAFTSGKIRFHLWKDTLSPLERYVCFVVGSF